MLPQNLIKLLNERPNPRIMPRQTMPALRADLGPLLHEVEDELSQVVRDEEGVELDGSVAVGILHEGLGEGFGIEGYEEVLGLLGGEELPHGAVVIDVGVVEVGEAFVFGGFEVLVEGAEFGEPFRRESVGFLGCGGFEGG